jgi:hypothetical protein
MNKNVSYIGYINSTPVCYVRMDFNTEITETGQSSIIAKLLI